MSNERLSALALEMDDQNNNQEEAMKREMRKIEQKHQEQIRILKKSCEIDLDIKSNMIEEQQRYDNKFKSYIEVFLILGKYQNWTRP